MARNPYLAAWRTRRRHRRRVEGPWSSLARQLLPLAVAVLLVPLVRPVFLGWLDVGRSAWPDGLIGTASRAGLLLVALLALDVYTALIRSPDRSVLDLHPVDAAGVVAFEVIRVARERAWLPLALGIVLIPVALAGAWGAWALLMGVVLGAFVLGLAASAMMHLLAVEVSEHPAFGGLLDLVRGHNPRAQAAFLYAPGLVLAVAGAAVLAAAWGVGEAWRGRPAAAALLAVPWIAAALAWIPVGRLARGNWFRATAVLADIDARYAALEDREEGHRVYLDWVVPRLPPTLGRYVLKDLRHGWRTRRIWITGPWLAGVVAGLAGWSRADAAPLTAAGLVIAAVWGFATLGAILDRDDPPFLRAWLPPEPGSRWAARALVLLLWAQGAAWPPFFAVWLRHGAGAALTVLGAALGSMALAVPLATLCGRWRTWGPWLYGPAAVLAAAGTAAWIGT